MPLYRVNFLFKHPLGGWSETYFTEEPSITSASVNAFILAPLRGKLLGVGADLIAYRVSDEGVTGDSEVTNNPAYTRILPSAASDTPWQTALCRLNATPIYRRHLALRGIPDLVYEPVTPTEKTNRDLWFQSLNSEFLARLKNDVAHWKERVHLRSVDNLPRKILQIVPGAGKYVLTLNSALSGAVVGDFLRILKIREFPALASAFPILDQSSVAPWTVDIAYNGPESFPYRHRAEARLDIVGSRQITGGDFVRFSSHRVGRFFGQPVGRRKRRRLPAF